MTLPKDTMRSVGWWPRGFLVALSFLTVLPVKAGPVNHDSEQVRSLSWYPIVGATVGLAVGMAGLVLNYLFGTFSAAVLMVAVEGGLTGGLHWDGLADTCDAVFSSRRAEKKLEIMRDSRIGTFGAAALFISLLLRTTLFRTLLNSPTMVPVVMAAYTVSRWIVVQAVSHHAYARPEGLGSAFQGKQGHREAWSATVLGVAAVAGTACLTLLVRSSSQLDAAATVVIVLVSAMAAAIVANHWASRIARDLGGLTGDVYGALAELGTTIFLLVFVMGVRVTGALL